MNIQNYAALKLSSFILFIFFNTSVLIAGNSPADWYLQNSFDKFNAKYSPCIIIKKDGTEMKCFSIDHKMYSFKGTLHYLESPEGKRKGIKVKELQSIEFIRNHHEMIIPEEGGREFMALKAVEGKVSLYLFKEIKYIYLPIIFPYGGIVKIPYKKYYRFLKSGNEMLNVRKGSFKESMSIYFKRQPHVIEKINNDIYNYLNMELLVREFNALNLGISKWTESPMAYEELRPRENTSYFAPSSKATVISGRKPVATIYIYCLFNKNNTTNPFQLFEGDSLIGSFDNNAIYKYQYEDNAIKEFTLASNGQKAQSKLLINPGRIYYIQGKWDAKNEKLLFKVEDPIAAHYVVEQRERMKK